MTPTPDHPHSPELRPTKRVLNLIKEQRLYLSLLFLLSFLFVWIMDYHKDHGDLPLYWRLITSLASTFVCMLLFQLCRMFKWVGYILLPLILIFCAGVYAATKNYCLELSYDVIASIMETNVNEAMGFVNTIVVLYFLFFVFLGVGAIYAANRFCPQKVCKNFRVLGLIFLFLSASSAVNSASYFALNPDFSESEEAKKNYLEGCLWPISDMRGIYSKIRQYVRREGAAMTKLKKLPSCADFPSECTNGKERIVIFHIGESLRADKIPMNGYERNTMPNMSGEPNVISIPRMLSYGTVTRSSVIGMLSDADLPTRTPRYSSYVDLFNKHQYSTNAVLTVENSIHDYSMNILTAHCQNRVDPSDRGNRTDNFIKEFKLELSRQTTPKQLFILYNMGNHVPFPSGEKFKKFLPDDFSIHKPLANLENMRNAYDNATLEYDDLIHRVISELKDKSAVYVFCSDHGVSLGEYGMFGQGSEVWFVRTPACFIWYSDKFAEENPKLIARLKENKEKQVSHEYLFGTMLSLGGIKSSLIPPQRDLTSPECAPYTGPRQEWPEYEQQLKSKGL